MNGWGFSVRQVVSLAARVGALALVFALFALLVPEGRFVDVRNIENILVQSAVVSAAAIGATLVIIAAGIDLSVGSVVAMTVVVIARILRAAPHDPSALWALLAVLGGVGAGALVGLINGALITSLRIVPFIVTLGTLQIVRGLGKGLAGNAAISAPETWINPMLDSVRQQPWRWIQLPPGVWLVLVLALLTALMLRYTVLGRHIFAIGSNEKTARLCGVSVWRTRLIVYTLAGLFAGVAGVLQFSYIGLGDPTTAVGLELAVIAAVVIGGGSLMGGEGTISGTIIGALIIGVLGAGGVLMGWPKWIQEVMTGGIIVAAVAIDQVRQRATLR
ncbi:MAG: ABC transporter permease [Phycisphaerales bacterium]|nr:ABC transporter permease [Phycisphaerales bacterium]